jgi:hypothetical protein
VEVTVMSVRHALRIAAVAVLAAAAFVALPGASAQALPPFGCGTVSAGSTSGVAAPITDVRVGHHIGYDRFVMQFAGSRVPHYTVTPKSSAVFWLDPSNKRVTLRGTAGIKIALFPASGLGSFHGPTDIKTTFPQLLEARNIGDFEAVTSWGLGLRHQSCKRVFTLPGPPRLVIDVPG